MADKKLIMAVVKGLITYIPGVTYLLTKKNETSKHSGTQAMFCYTLWLSILVFLKENGINTKFNKVGEIGSGGSLGVGICALLSGCEKYYALEIEGGFNKVQNLKLLNEIVLLFRNKTWISDDYHQLNIKINSNEYPQNIIEPLFLNENFISEIRNDIVTEFKNSKRISIIKNWNLHTTLLLDFVFSRAVMEHVKSPEKIYNSISTHMKIGSYMFHNIEFHSHGITKRADGHYLIPDYLWKVIFGRRSYFLNRWHTKEHYKNIFDNGFEILNIQEYLEDKSGDNVKIVYEANILAQKRFEKFPNENIY